MTLRQLRQIASDLGVTLYSRKSKEELVEAISTRQEEGGGRSLETIESEMAPAPRPAAETRVVFLPRDPQWAYVFWDISEDDRSDALHAGASQ
ncbi:Rho termination factor N-terminal domain-containing protein, partial [Synechococcus sp. CCY 9618]|uniref:Rho termination factor N-terminal domain-containing protein n=1 Tax=Synechococcus sp. CCY 9618 TaxID=2815602 RepID=UPI001C248D08